MRYPPKNNPRSVAAAMIAVMSLVLVVAGCGAKAHTGTTTVKTPTHATTSTTAPSKTVATSTATSHSSTSKHARATVAPPAGGPVPPGFDPSSFTAISAQQFWLLGSAPCSHPVCTSIVRTTDGGRHFVGIPAPAARLTAANSGAPGISTLAFADQLDGYAYGTDFPRGGPLWTTHDGGAHWRLNLADLLAFATAGDSAYAVTGTCANGKCVGVQLQRSGVSDAHWTATKLPVAVASSPIGITAHGTSVWMSVTPVSASGQHQTLIYSVDRGAHLTTTSSPCVPGLGGSLAAVSLTSLWAVCPTGMQAGVARSTDGGTQWSNAEAAAGQSGTRRVAAANSAQIAPVNTTTAVLATGNGSELLLTTDGGRIYNPVFSPGRGARHWGFIGFTDPSTGSGLLSDGSRSGPDGLPNTGLWRTADGGVHWHGPVRIAR